MEPGQLLCRNEKKKKAQKHKTKFSLETKFGLGSLPMLSPLVLHEVCAGASFAEKPSALRTYFDVGTIKYTISAFDVYRS